MKIEPRYGIVQGTMQRFGSEHFAEYRSWYADAAVNQGLGPAPDRTWLDHVLREKDGCQLAYLRGGEMLAVSGIVFPVKREACYTLTDLAVHPARRGEGLGADALQATLQYTDFPTTAAWQAFVDRNNLAARAFFQSQGWQSCSEGTDRRGMLCYKAPNFGSRS